MQRFRNILIVPSTQGVEPPPLAASSMPVIVRSGYCAPAFVVPTCSLRSIHHTASNRTNSFSNLPELRPRCTVAC